MMGSSQNAYHPPTVEDCEDEGVQSPTLKHNLVIREHNAAPTPLLLGNLAAPPSKVLASQTPRKSCLKRSASDPTPTSRKPARKTVAFGETTGTDIITGEAVPPSDLTAKEYRFWWSERHGHKTDQYLQYRKKKRMRRIIRRVTDEWKAEASAREAGGERRVEWRKGLQLWMKKNGFNGLAGLSSSAQ